MPPGDNGNLSSCTPPVKHEDEESQNVSAEDSSSAPRKYRPLLSKPPPKTFALPSRSKAPAQRRCGVALCRQRPCNLASHKQYAKALRSSQQSQSPSSNTLLKIATSVAGSRQISAQASRTTTPPPELLLSDNLPHLPFEEPCPPELRQLFHAFATDFFYRVLIRFRQPLDLPTFWSKTISSIASNEVFALACLAHTKFDIMTRQDQYTADQACALIYSRLTQGLRKRLDNLQDPDIDGLLMYIVAILNFDMIFNNAGSLQNHREGIKHLVSARGGVHYLGWSLPYIIHADQRLAVLSGDYPLLSRPARKFFQLPARPPRKYAHAFHSDLLARILKSDVLEFCQDVGRLIDLFEHSQISYDADTPNHGIRNLLPHFHFSRDQIGTEFAYLHAEYVEAKDKNWCVLLAARLVEYPISYGNFMPVLATFMANKLCDVLKTQDLSTVWSDCPELLCWILFVLTTVPVNWPGRDWTETALKRHLTAKYGAVAWPDIWVQQQWEILTSLSWSDRYLRDAFDQVCQRLYSGNLH